MAFVYKAKRHMDTIELETAHWDHLAPGMYETTGKNTQESIPTK